MDKLLVQEQWRVIDQSSSGLYTSALQSFGMDDTLCASVGKGGCSSHSTIMGSYKHDCTWYPGYKASLFTRRSITF